MCPFLVLLTITVCRGNTHHVTCVNLAVLAVSAWKLGGKSIAKLGVRLFLHVVGLDYAKPTSFQSVVADAAACCCTGSLDQCTFTIARAHLIHESRKWVDGLDWYDWRTYPLLMILNHCSCRKREVGRLPHQQYSIGAGGHCLLMCCWCSWITRCVRFTSLCVQDTAWQPFCVAQITFVNTD